VQLASYRDVRNAERGWQVLQRDHGDVIGGLERRLVRVTLPGKGVYHRLFAAGLSSADADRVCRTLKARGAFCAKAQL